MTDTVDIGFKFTKGKAPNATDGDAQEKIAALIAEDADLGRTGMRHTFALPVKYKAGHTIDEREADWLNRRLAADFSQPKGEAYAVARLTGTLEAFSDKVFAEWEGYSIHTQRVMGEGGGKVAAAKVSSITPIFAKLFGAEVAPIMAQHESFEGMNKAQLSAAAEAYAAGLVANRGKLSQFENVENPDMRARAVELWKAATEKAEAVASGGFSL